MTSTVGSNWQSALASRPARAADYCSLFGGRESPRGQTPCLSTFPAFALPASGVLSLGCSA